MKLRFTALLALLLLSLFAAGCGLMQGSILGPNDTATVIAKTAQIRTGYAVVASDLLEVKRGDRLDILDSVESPDVKGLIWYRVRAHDETQTEGWIEAQNIITAGTLQKSKDLADQYKDQPPQAAGSIRSVSNLRSQPDMSPENVLFKLAQGSNFEILAYKFVPKQEAPDVDDAPKGQQKPGQKVKPKEDEDDGPPRMDEKYDMWYLVRLDPAVSPAPAARTFRRNRIQRILGPRLRGRHAQQRGHAQQLVAHRWRSDHQLFRCAKDAAQSRWLGKYAFVSAGLRAAGCDRPNRAGKRW